MLDSLNLLLLSWATMGTGATLANPVPDKSFVGAGIDFFPHAKGELVQI